jgi:hypothetical protein
MVTTQSHFLPQAEIPSRVAALQRQLVEILNNAGHGALVRPPAPAQLKAIKTARGAEALARSLVRPV